MPIPPFDAILNILPPHLGDPRIPSDLSPYECTLAEFCTRFSTSSKRTKLLEGLLDFRSEILALGIKGFQWLGGSFLEDIEAQEGRAPGDIDVITFVEVPPNSAALAALFTAKKELLNRAHVKTTYSLDHFLLPLGASPVSLVSHSRYWYGLFSHRRDRTWKGMLKTPLSDKATDDLARKTLQQPVQP